MPVAMFATTTASSMHYPSLTGSVYSPGTAPGPLPGSVYTPSAPPGPLSGSVYSPGAPGPLTGSVYSPSGPPYPPAALPSSQRQLEDAYRQMAVDYRHHPARMPSDMYGSALSSLDRYYYSARDAMYRAATAMPPPPHAFMPPTQSNISSQYPSADRGGAGGYMSGTYGQSYAGFMCPPPHPATDKQYQLTPGARPGVEYLEATGSGSSSAPSQAPGSPYTRHIYNMMPRYF